jgi:BASS family bile acid:Na+ symporter
VDILTVTKFLTSLGLVATMLAIGLKVHVSEIFAAARQIRLVVLALVANFLLVPAATVGLLYLFNPEPLVAAGFLILAVCPGAPFGPLFATIAKGDLPSAIGLMVILAASSAILSPLLLAALLGQFLPAGDLHVSPLSIVQALSITQILPLVIGIGIYEKFPSFAASIVKPLSLIANVILLSVVILLLIAQFPTLAQIRLRGWFGMLLLLVASVVIGWLCGGPALATRKTLAVTTASRNAAVGLVIVANSFAGTAAATAVVAFALFSILGTLAFAIFLGSRPVLTLPTPSPS